MAFKIGQKVVCVTALEGDCGPGAIEPDKGDVGTICNIFVGSVGKVCLELIEYPAPETTVFDAGWLAEYFRPVIERTTETGMAILREILDRESIDERKPAKVS